MKLADLLTGLDPLEVHADPATDVLRVTRDSRDADATSAFVAIRGAKVDGHSVVPALRAVAFVEQPVSGAYVLVRDTKAALPLLAARLHGDPTRTVRVCGITGTKGKTTTAALVERALRADARHVGRIGTTGSFLDGESLHSELTTPEAPELQRLFAHMRDAGARDAVIEVSSIGLVQRRVDAIPFHCALFTNLGRDHLDFHGTMDAYAAAKSMLFRDEHLRPPGGLPRALLNSDDAYSAAMHAPPDSWTFGFAPTADLHVSILASGAEGLHLAFRTPLGETEIQSPLVGRHNAMNLAAALGAALCHGVALDVASAGLAAVSGVEGRLEPIQNDRGLLVAVDYAHTPESLEAALQAVRAVVPGKVWCVFGCGGDRDPGKRPKMGAIAARLADRVVVTSDNPRTERPESILDAIVAGMDQPPAHVDADRRAAIHYALQHAERGDAVLIAGKGHETYQEIAGHKHPFDDREVARSALEGM